MARKEKLFRLNTKSYTMLLHVCTARGVNIEYGWGGVVQTKTDQLLNLDRLQLKTVNNVSNWFSRNS